MIPPKQLNGEEMVKKCGAKQQATPIPPNYQRSSNIENTWIDSNFRIHMWNVHSLEGPCASNIHGGMALQTIMGGWLERLTPINPKQSSSSSQSRQSQKSD